MNELENAIGLEKSLNGKFVKQFLMKFFFIMKILFYNEIFVYLILMMMSSLIEENVEYFSKDWYKDVLTDAQLDALENPPPKPKTSGGHRRSNRPKTERPATVK